MSIACFQIDATRVMAPPRVRVGLPPKQFGKHLQGMAFAFAFALALSLFTVASVYADEVPQAWVPEALTLPDDAEVTMDRAVGSSIRIFSFSTEADVEALFKDWPRALKESGYDIRPQQSELGKFMIEFSGRSILNAKITRGAASGGDRIVITFDATLE